jgi:hypothetical protein
MNKDNTGSLPEGAQILYACDPNKNTECNKSGCLKDWPVGCRHTTRKEYADNNAPLVFSQCLNEDTVEGFRASLERRANHGRND